MAVGDCPCWSIAPRGTRIATSSWESEEAMWGERGRGPNRFRTTSSRSFLGGRSPTVEESVGGRASGAATTVRVMGVGSRLPGLRAAHHGDRQLRRCVSGSRARDRGRKPCRVPQRCEGSPLPTRDIGRAVGTSGLMTACRCGAGRADQRPSRRIPIRRGQAIPGAEVIAAEESSNWPWLTCDHRNSPDWPRPGDAATTHSGESVAGRPCQEERDAGSSAAPRGRRADTPRGWIVYARSTEITADLNDRPEAPRYPFAMS